MLRLVHTQVASGQILVDDIDDGLPNKTARRGVAPHYSYERDGYANKPKQACYVPVRHPADPTLPGFIDLEETDRVLRSLNKGKIAGFVKQGLLSASLFATSDVAAPVLTSATLDDPGAGDLTLAGTALTSLVPNVTSVIITGTGAVTLTAAQIVAGGGSISATEIVIPAALVPGIAAAGSSVTVRADNQVSAAVAVA